MGRRKGGSNKLTVEVYKEALKECPAFGMGFDDTVEECIACKKEVPDLYNLCKDVFLNKVELPDEVFDFTFDFLDDEDSMKE